jgi:branched-subunit amino acid permease
MSLRSPIVLIGLLVVAVVLVLVGLLIQLNPSLHDPAHAISRKAVVCWAAAAAALVGASFARPRSAG